ncbi:TerC family protein [Fulvivirga lutea]|uniref:TerC family protein n=1 Tax=Fulvivirga lutea TaxID=2810512 RepID=A0A974WI09_9BACT|nr:TerC family protein [Fulvivirga lutea]QSE96485.1 TerC family protein [Fulvivirga lutea]
MLTYLWIFFSILIVLLLIIDLFVIHRKDKEISLKHSLIETGIWILISLAFNVVIYFTLGSKSGSEFLTAYLIEKSLSVDNLFVFQIIFTYYLVPAKLQHRVLFWGIVGSIIMRAIFIYFGVKLIENFDFLLYIMGLFLVIAGIKLLLGKESKINPKNNLIGRLIGNIIPVMKNYNGNQFFVTRNWKVYATPLFIVLVAIETTDIIFALDSVPAILGITVDPFIVYTSNIFAILGLRALYFSLSGIMSLFHLLKYGLGVILVFIGVKIFCEDFYHIDTLYSLGVVLTVLVGSIVGSLMIKPRLANNTEIPIQ